MDAPGVVSGWSPSSARALENVDVCRRLADHRLVAPVVVDGAMTGDIFRTYVERVLAPTLVPR
jgi:hypothetical protein